GPPVLRVPRAGQARSVPRPGRRRRHDEGGAGDVRARPAARDRAPHHERRVMSHDVPIGKSHVSLAQLNDRSREIFRQIVETYLATGEPVGSRNLSRLIATPLSPASVRNVMSDLEQLGLVYAPHTSAGRLPTELGLRFFVDALLEIGDASAEERREIAAHLADARTS